MKLVKTQKYYQDLATDLRRAYEIAKPYRRLCKLMGLSNQLANYLTVQCVRKNTGLDISEIFYRKEEEDEG